MLKIKDGFVLRKIAGKYVVVAIGSSSLNGMIKLNYTGAFCWDHLKEGCSKNELVTALMAEYGISEEQGISDVESFLNTLLEVGCLSQN